MEDVGDEEGAEAGPAVVRGEREHVTVIAGMMDAAATRGTSSTIDCNFRDALPLQSDPSKRTSKLPFVDLNMGCSTRPKIITSHGLCEIG